MTAPMSGQSPQKKTESGRWRTEQLERRPPPVATAGAYPHIQRRRTTSDTVPTNSAGESITWSSSDTSEAGAYFSAPTSQTTRIESQGAGSLGRYEISVGVKWDPEFNAGSGIAINSGAFGWFPSSYWKHPYGASGLERGDIAHVFHFTFRLATTSDMDFTVDVYHEHASDQDIIDAVLEIGYLGPYLGSVPGTYFF